MSLWNLSARGARGRSLPSFLAENRPTLITAILRASEGTIIDRTTVLRPRDSPPQRVRINVSEAN